MNSVEIPFVIIDQNKPFLINAMRDETWMFYWHPDKKWVTLKRLRFDEIALLSKRAIPREQAEVYGPERIWKQEAIVINKTRAMGPSEIGMGGRIEKSHKEGDVTVIDEMSLDHVSMGRKQ